MSHLLSRRSGSLALALTGLAALVIGCGGGGGGGGNTSTNTTGTVGSTGSTGSTGTASSTGTSGVTIGGGTDGGSGMLAANAIYYLVPSSTGYDVRYSTEDGTVAGTYATGVPQDSPVAAPDPTASGIFFFAAAPSSTSALLGIYRNTTTAQLGATIVSPRYTEIDALQVSRDGKTIVFVASATATGDPHLYKATVGVNATPVLVDGDYVADANLSSDGTKVVYEKVPTDDTELDVADLTAKTPTPVALTNDALDEGEPQFSKDGTKVVFSIDDGTGTGRHVLGFLSTPGGSITTIAPFVESNISVYAPSFNSDGTRIAFEAESTDSSQNGIYTCDLSGLNRRVVALTTVQPRRALYWTNAGGRAAGLGETLHLSPPHRR